MNEWLFHPKSDRFVLYKKVNHDTVNWDKPIAGLRIIEYKLKQVEMSNQEFLNWFVTQTTLESLDYGTEPIN